MKKTLYTSLILLLFSIGSIQAQSLDEINRTPEFRPFYTGGEPAMRKFLAENFNYTNLDRTIHGEMVLGVLISKTGDVDSVRVLQRLQTDYENEAIRVVKRTPKWIPACMDGLEVDKWYTIPITFRLNTNKQSRLVEGPPALTYSEIMPEYTEGGYERMRKFISQNLKFPIDPKPEMQGRIIAKFVITKTGDIEQIEILRSLSPEYDREAIKVIESMPKWIPGKQNGKEVDVNFTLPITFRTDTLSSNDSILYSSEVMPEFDGGENKMMEFIRQNLKIPVISGQEHIKGRVTVRFVVTKIGEIELIEILRGLTPERDREAIRVIESMPKWIPGKQDGKVVDVYYTLPVVFSDK